VVGSQDFILDDAQATDAEVEVPVDLVRTLPVRGTEEINSLRFAVGSPVSPRLPGNSGCGLHCHVRIPDALPTPTPPSNLSESSSF